MRKIILLFIVVFAINKINAQSALSKMQPFFSNDPKKDLANGNENNVWQYGIGGKSSKLANNVYIQLTPTKYFNVSTNEDGSTVYEDLMDVIKLSDDIYISKIDEKKPTKRVLVLYNYALFKLEVQTFSSPYQFKCLDIFICGTNKRYGADRTFIGGFGVEWESKNQAFVNGGAYFNAGQFKNEAFQKMLDAQKVNIENTLKGVKDNQAVAAEKKLNDEMEAARISGEKEKKENAIKAAALIAKFGEAKLFTSEYLKWKEKGNPQLTAFYTNKDYFSRWAKAIKATNGYLSDEFREWIEGYNQSGTIIYQGTGLDSRIACYKHKTEGHEYISIKNFDEFDRVDLWDSHTNLSKFKQSYYWIYNGNKKTKVEGDKPIGALFWVKGNLIHYNTSDYRYHIFNVWTYPGATTFELKKPADYFELSDYFNLVIVPAQKKVELK